MKKRLFIIKISIVALCLIGLIYERGNYDGWLDGFRSAVCISSKVPESLSHWKCDEWWKENGGSLK